MKNSKQILPSLGVYGFDNLELIILAALITEDPMLLIGKSGTGKTYLLNSISEALNLNHRHYNASFISFDDLIGFPYPNVEGQTVTYLKTPATIWGAESILIDEISRCKPETQNKFFSIIQEKKIQGIELSELKYRWAAMNPLMDENNDTADYYEGSLSLDQALADRFAFIIEVPDWNELTVSEQELVINPAGEGKINNTSKELIQFIKKLREKFIIELKNPNKKIILYCRIISTILGDSGFRISPRRARQLARNFAAIFLVAKEIGLDQNENQLKKLFYLGLSWSLPHRAWQGNISSLKIETAHNECIKLIGEVGTENSWLSEFNFIKNVPKKIKMLLNAKIDKETKSIAIMKFLNNGSKTKTGMLAFAAQPFFEKIDILNEEAFNEITNHSTKVMDVEGKLEWTERINANNPHPTLSNCVKFTKSLKNKDKMRTKRANQFFLYLILNNVSIPEPEFIENELNECFKVIKEELTNAKNI